MSGQAAFDKPARPAASCREETVVERRRESGKEVELNGVEEGHEMSDGEGGETDGEGELAAPDWRVRAGPSMKQRMCNSVIGVLTA